LIPRRTLAAVVTGVLAAAGVVSLSASSAHAAPIEYTSQCVNQTIPSTEIDPTQTKIDISVDSVKPTYHVGETVIVHWKWLAYADVPPKTPYVTQIDEDSTLPKGQIVLSGAQSTLVDLLGTRKNPVAKLGEPLVLTDMKAPVTLIAAGTVDLTPKQYSTSTLAFGAFDSETLCTPTTPVPVGASITVEAGQVKPPEIQAPDFNVRPGAEFALTGSGFVPDSMPKAALCDADGTNCLPSRFETSTLAIDGQGNLTGMVRLTPPLPDGSYVVRVTAGGGEARDDLEVRRPVLQRHLLVSATSGPVGTTVRMTGTDWTPGVSILATGLDVDGSHTGSTIGRATADLFGAFTIVYRIDDPLTTRIWVREGNSVTKQVIVPFTVTPRTVPLGQDITGTVNPGVLSLTQAGSGIDFGSATVTGTEQRLTAPLNRVTVTDARSGNLGWSLTGVITDLTTEGGTATIPAANVAWTPACAVEPGSPASAVTTGSAGPLGSTAATLCSQAPDTVATGGRFTADAELALTVPAFAAAGTYTGTLTLSLS